MNDTITFIFAANRPADFTEEIYNYRNIIAKSNAVVIHDFKIFNYIFQMASDDFTCRIIIHAAIADNDPNNIGPAGLNFLGEIKSIPELRDANIPFISRKKGLFLDLNTRKETLFKEVDGYSCFYTGIANDPKHVETFVDMLPVFSKKGSASNTKWPLVTPDTKNTGNHLLQQPPEFAVLTALYDSEFQVYQEQCELQRDDSLGNCYVASFARKNERVHNDYDRPFFLIHQEQMGLVDAAIYSTQIIDRIDPKFLLMGGVCGGLQSGVNMYDIIVPTVIYDFATGSIESLTDDTARNEKLKGLPEIALQSPGHADKKISGHFKPKNFKATAEALLVKHLERNKDAVIHDMWQLMPESEKKDFPQNLNIHFNEFACGPWVVKMDGFFDEFLLNEYSKNIKGLEMESYSVNRASNIAQSYERYSLVVKSVMDFTTSEKKDATKRLASLISLVCIRAMMPFLIKFSDPKATGKKK